MAPLVDTGIIEVFSWLLPVLLIYGLMAGILLYTKVVKSALLSNLIAIIIALIALITPKLLEVIKFIAPWTTIFIIFILFILIAVKFLGATDDDIAKALKEFGITYWVIGIFVMILLAGFGKVYLAKGDFLGESPAESIDGLQGSSEAGERSFFETLFHPKVLGFLLIMIIAMFTVMIVGSEGSKIRT